MKELNKQHVEGVDVLRAIAILAVFFFHSKWGYTNGNYGDNGLVNFNSLKELALILSPTGFGWSGVELFLLISGFLIHYGYLVYEQSGRVFSVSEFFSKRFWRIFPPYFIVLVFFSFAENPVLYFQNFERLKDFLLHVFFLHNLSESSFFSINPAFWSLALEVQLYLIYPVLLLLRNKYGMKITFRIILSLSLLLAALGFAWNGMQEHLPYDASVFKFWYVWGAGALLAEKFSSGERLFQRRALMISLLFFLVMMLSKVFFVSSKFQVYFCTIAWLAFFDWFLNSPYIKASLHKPLFRLLSLIGICSYSIYLIHQPFLIDLLAFVLPWWQGAIGMLVKCGLVFFMLFIISYGMHVFIERPGIAFGARLRNRKKLR